MSDPTLSAIDSKNKLALVWNTLKTDQKRSRELTSLTSHFLTVFSLSFKSNIRWRFKTRNTRRRIHSSFSIFCFGKICIFCREYLNTDNQPILSVLGCKLFTTRWPWCSETVVRNCYCTFWKTASRGCPMQSKLRWRSYKMLRQGFYYPSVHSLTPSYPNGGRQTR